MGCGVKDDRNLNHCNWQMLSHAEGVDFVHANLLKLTVIRMSPRRLCDACIPSMLLLRKRIRGLDYVDFSNTKFVLTSLSMPPFT